MTQTSKIFIALWGAGSLYGALAGYQLATATRHCGSHPCAASARSRTAPARPRAPALSRAAATPAAPVLIEGASSYVAASCGTPLATRSGSLRSPSNHDPLPQGGDRYVAANETRFLGRSPHVPLGRYDGGVLHPVTGSACASWSRVDDRWRALDAWGQVVGLARTSSGEGNSYTQCFELCLENTQGSAGSGLFVSEGGPWTAPPSARWTPSGAERAAYARFLSSFDEMFMAPAVDARGNSSRTTMFFQAPNGTRVMGHFAVSSGRSIVLSRIDSMGRWRVMHTIAPTAAASAEEFALIAVFDVDRDGTPEVVFQEQTALHRYDKVLSSGDRGLSWRVIADSVGGISMESTPAMSAADYREEMPSNDPW